MNHLATVSHNVNHLDTVSPNCEPSIATDPQCHIIMNHLATVSHNVNHLDTVSPNCDPSSKILYITIAIPVYTDIQNVSMFLLSVEYSYVMVNILKLSLCQLYCYSVT